MGKGVAIESFQHCVNVDDINDAYGAGTLQLRQSAQLLLHQISALEQIVGDPKITNIPAKLMLHLYDEQNLNIDELEKVLDAPTKIFDRYVNLLELRGLIEVFQEETSGLVKIRISDLTRELLGDALLS